ncbi:Petal formation-expressed [Parasponia andersonii]|uniref:Petal formation-expressed n=1 Tax=Parasponia andersonii TaxID=3476 RepID=A0A2P5AI35_PARAD|nr:Petal formation-expressed [Parasponia andersonii]
MATLQASSMAVCMKASTGSSQIRRRLGESFTPKATLSLPKIQNPATSSTSAPTLSLPKFPLRGFGDHHDQDLDMMRSSSSSNETTSLVQMENMHAVLEAVSDRVEMHKNIGAQRDNWNNLLLTSINAITLTAATMAGISSVLSSSSSASSPAIALKLSSTLLYLAATGILVVMNKIQPSQLAEEQRNAARLFKQLQTQIQTRLSLGLTPAALDLNEAMEKVLALDKAYPLPLLGTMLEKFPKTVEPAVWWPRKVRRNPKTTSQVSGLGRDYYSSNNNNGWSGKLEEEMREVSKVMERKDVADYLRLSEKALRLNKILAISGPLLTGFGALATAISGGISSAHGIGAAAAVVGVVAGALASVVNTLEHGCQVGMVFEMYRSNAGFFRLMEETIESNLRERDVERRENGQVFQTKVALQLGRSLSELKNLAASRWRKNGSDLEEFASKLF